VCAHLPGTAEQSVFKRTPGEGPVAECLVDQFPVHHTDTVPVAGSLSVCDSSILLEEFPSQPEGPKVATMFMFG
jgi:hypothetical protein